MAVWHAIAAFCTPTVVLGVVKAVPAVRKWMRDRDGKIAADAAATAARHAEEKAYRERMASDMTYVRTRIDDAHDRINDVAANVAHVKGRLDERDSGHGKSGILAAVK